MNTKLIIISILLSIVVTSLKELCHSFLVNFLDYNNNNNNNNNDKLYLYSAISRSSKALYRIHKKEKIID